MKFTAVLALAAGATASFTKIVRKAEPEPLVVGTLDMYMNSKCLSPEEPRDTIAMLNNECYTFDAGYGSFFFNRDEHLLGGCMAAFWDNAECNGNIQWHSEFQKCADNKLGHALWSASVSCPNATTTAH